MKILFVYPGIASIGFDSFKRSRLTGDISGTAVPNGIGYLAAAVHKAGFDVDVTDLRYLSGYDALEEKIASSDAQLVGISVQTPSFEYADKVAAIAKRLGKITVAGGVHATVAHQDFLKSGNFDHIIMGEGEISLVDLMKSCERSEPFPQVVHGTIVENLDDYPYAMDFPLYEPVYHNVHNIEFGRGCPGRCTYCISWDEVMYGKKTKQRSIDKVLEGIAYFKEKYDFYNLAIEDVNATSKRKVFVEFCERLTDMYPKLRLTISTRVDCFDEDIAKALHLFNEAIVWFGFETFSPRLLKFLRKRVNPERYYKVAALCDKYKIDIGANVLLGIPTETDEDIEMTYGFIKTIQPAMLYFNVLSPFPGTVMADYCRENNLIDPDLPYERYEITQIMRYGLLRGIDYDRVRAWLPKFASCQRNLPPLNKGILLEQQNDQEAALKLYMEAIDKDKNSVRPSYYTASLLRRTGRTEEAMKHFKAMDNFTCDTATSYFFAQRHFHMGELSLENGNYSQAQNEYKACINLLPEHKKAVQRLEELINRT